MGGGSSPSDDNVVEEDVMERKVVTAGIYLDLSRVLCALAKFIRERITVIQEDLIVRGNPVGVVGKGSYVGRARECRLSERSERGRFEHSVGGTTQCEVIATSGGNYYCSKRSLRSQYALWWLAVRTPAGATIWHIRIARLL